MPLRTSVLVAVLLSASAAAQPPVPRAGVEARASRMFALGDRDHDGFLSRQEYGRAVLAVARRYDPKVPADGPGMARALAQFDALDQGHTGRIPRATFVAAALAHFDGADMNHDGTVTPDEARLAAAIKQKMLRTRPR
ncbi:hypothetical protein [Sphingomonas sp.]|uniref:hypothetical protein n=1 Tax=Sphingomonas sp. TaxID=28214 RepID=UPI003AFFC3C4